MRCLLLSPCTLALRLPQPVFAFGTVIAVRRFGNAATWIEDDYNRVVVVEVRADGDRDFRRGFCLTRFDDRNWPLRFRLYVAVVHVLHGEGACHRRIIAA